MKKALLDTNIIIHRETHYVRRADIGYLFKWLDKLKYEKCIHPITKTELKKHDDPRVVKSFVAKLSSYNELKTQAPIDETIKTILTDFDTTENDDNDTLLLNEVYQRRVDILISEDNKIHRKAHLLQISEKVFKIEDFLHKSTVDNPDLTDYKTLSIRKEHFGRLNLKDHFFDSFKNDYQGFEDWFTKKSDETAYICESDHITAFLYIKTEGKDENYSDITPRFPPKRRLKIGTFKVINTGYKLGERFIKIVFDNALEQNVDEIYLTIFENTPEQKYLVALIEAWGFKHFGKKKSESGIEQVYVRDFSKKFDANNIRYTYPFISQNRKKFIVPIYPEYHTDLLPDSILTNERKENFLQNKAYRNAIHKIYISRSIRRDMKQGDIILFYRTGGYHKSVITTVGLVDNVTTDIENLQQFIELCKARTVFSNEELTKHWNYSNKPFIVNFLYINSLPKPFLNLKKLIELGVIPDIQSAPRGFEEISDEKFHTIMEESDANKSIIVD